MLVIRLQRTGRSGHAQFRFIVQDKRFSPTRGRIVAYLGNYNPHTKTATLDSEKASQYLNNGAQPSDRVAALLQKEGVKLPDWVKTKQPKERTVRNPEKRRSTAPAQPAAEAPAEEPAAKDEA
jgi:small subunit ribosomal protein S16